MTNKDLRTPLAAISEIAACFSAAYVEGLQEALAETTDERIKDLVERRLLPAYDIAASFASPDGAAGADEPMTLSQQVTQWFPRASMPILTSCKSRIKSVPWSVIAGHERQALINHGQTLERLAERGGLSPAEAVAIIGDRKFERMDLAEAEEQLLKLWRARQ